jgi:hypothetical protein
MVRGGRSPLMRVMTEIALPTYTTKFRFFEIGTRTATVEFPRLFSQQKFL